MFRDKNAVVTIRSKSNLNKLMKRSLVTVLLLDLLAGKCKSNLVSSIGTESNNFVDNRSSPVG